MLRVLMLLLGLLLLPGHVSAQPANNPDRNNGDQDTARFKSNQEANEVRDLNPDASVCVQALMTKLADPTKNIAACDRVIKSAEFAHASKQQRSLTYLSRGLTHLESGNLKSAISDFTLYFQLAPTGFFASRAHFGRGLAYLKLHEFEKAVEDASKALEVETLRADKVAAYNLRAHAEYELGRHSHAESDFRKALEIDPSNQDAQNMMTTLKKGKTPGS